MTAGRGCRVKSDVSHSAVRKAAGPWLIATAARLLDLPDNYFLTISAFSSIASPSLSATLPLSVMVLPQESAS